jgi:hypothetical protein
MLAQRISRQVSLIFMSFLILAQVSAAADAADSRSSSSSPRSPINRDQAVGMTKVIIKVAGKELPETLADNPTHVNSRLFFPSTL